jgi:hypothetical protein
MAVFKIMNHMGDETVLEYDRTDKAAVAKAMARFKEIVAEHYTAGTRPSTSGELTLKRHFDPNAEETVFIRPSVGG